MGKNDKKTKKKETKGKKTKNKPVENSFDLSSCDCKWYDLCCCGVC